MTVAELDTVQNRLENSSDVAQNLSADIGEVRNMLHGAGNQGRFSPAEVNQKKSRIKTDIARLITELTAINNLIY